MGGFYIKLICCTKKTQKYTLEPLKSFKVVVVKVLKDKSSNRGRVVCKLGHFRVNNHNYTQELYINFKMLARYVKKGARISPTLAKHILI